MELKHLNAAFEVKALSDNGLFEGYASVFDTLDGGGDVVARGAFSDSLAAHRAAGTMPKMLWQHDPAEPLGVWRDMAEDSHGLYVKGRLLTSEIRRAAEIHALMKEGALDGLSIGYAVVEATRDERSGARTLLKVDLWETSIVSFPMNEGARVAAVKAALSLGALPTKKEFEGFLREAGGLSRSQAKAFVARGYTGIRPREVGDGPDFDQTLTLIRAMTARINGAC
ncbi:MAG: HK97 family phage prohead protease [Sphingomonadales bacterium]